MSENMLGLSGGQSAEADLGELQRRLAAQAKSGAQWFYWIAGLSLINSVIQLTGGTWSFVVGLGVTQIVDAIAAAVASQGGGSGGALRAIALVADLGAAALFVLFGVLAAGGKRWAFLVGMVLYAIDGLIVLKFADFVSAGFHAFACYGLYRGLAASRQLALMTPTGTPAATAP